MISRLSFPNQNDNHKFLNQSLLNLYSGLNRDCNVSVDRIRILFRNLLVFFQILEYNLNEKLITKWLIIEWGLIDKILRKEWAYVPQSITNQTWELIAEWNRKEWGMIENVRSPTACNLKIKLSITQSLLNHKVSARNLTHEWIVSEDFPLWLKNSQLDWGFPNHTPTKSPGVGFA